MAQPNISVAAETIFNLGPLPVTNALISTWVVMALLFIISLLVTRNLQKKPTRVQMMVELIVGSMYGFFRNLGGKYGDKFAPLALTLFFFIVVSNWFGLIPGVGTIGFFEGAEPEATKIVTTVNAQTEHSQPVTESAPLEEKSETTAMESKETVPVEHSPKFVPFFRGPTADLNTTLALGLIAFFAIQYYGFTLAGASYVKRFIDLRSPIYFFVGLLEVISDISKILSFAFRLFGNVFAGEVLLTIMAFLFAFFLPIPFYGLELFVGFIQALVFAMLTTVFTSIAVAHGEHMQSGHAHESHVEAQVEA